MEIIRETDMYNVRLDQVEKGRTFLYEGKLHMVVGEASVSRYLIGDWHDKDWIMCVNLEDNILNGIRKDETVMLMKAKIML